MCSVKSQRSKKKNLENKARQEEETLQMSYITITDFCKWKNKEEQRERGFKWEKWRTNIRKQKTLASHFCSSNPLTNWLKAGQEAAKRTPLLPFVKTETKIQTVGLHYLKDCWRFWTFHGNNKSRACQHPALQKISPSRSFQIKLMVSSPSNTSSRHRGYFPRLWWWACWFWFHGGVGFLENFQILEERFKSHLFFDGGSFLSLPDTLLASSFLNAHGCLHLG